MRAGAYDQVNLSRVPATLVDIEESQKGELRVIHPVAMVVGDLASGDKTMRYTSPEPETFEVPADGTYFTDMGSPIAYRKGDVITKAEAWQFPAFRGDDAEEAAPETEEAEEAPEVEERAEEAAPENRADKAPQNRRRKS